MGWAVVWGPQSLLVCSVVLHGLLEAYITSKAKRGLLAPCLRLASKDKGQGQLHVTRRLTCWLFSHELAASQLPAKRPGAGSCAAVTRYQPCIWLRGSTGSSRWWPFQRDRPFGSFPAARSSAFRRAWPATGLASARCSAADASVGRPSCQPLRPVPVLRASFDILSSRSIAWAEIRTENKGSAIRPCRPQNKHIPLQATRSLRC